MTIKQYIELEKIKDQFNLNAVEYIKKHGKKIEEINKIENTLKNISNELQHLTKYFYEQ